ncbi:MAG TPA: lactate racemase domain-containing protein [Roseimicrobium sp.]|nr:lactate racemase domain-containing protein [Roseimicrobium sp.]
MLPRILRVRQNFPITPPLDITATLAMEFAKLRPHIRSGSRIAVGVGSRGISNLIPIVAAVIGELRRAGAIPFIIPAMGSHGGATPEGQRDVLASYGITEASMGVPIRDSLETRQIGATSDGVPVVCSTEALGADGIILINRIKPHTDFFGNLGSGLLKMSVIGLGKRAGATAMHLAATQLGHERVIRAMAGVVLKNAPVLGGVAILENQFHDTARLVVIPRDEMETAEDALLVEARSLMPLLPFEDIDLLIVDRIGKNISGAGMDPNVVHRSVHGYDSLPMRGNRPSPFIRRIFVRGLTPETHGNAIGIGMADATTVRLVREMDARITNINALTALTPQCAKIPIAFDTDREAIERLLASLPISDPRTARIVHVADTLSLAEMEISDALWNQPDRRPGLVATTGAHDMEFDPEGLLSPL